MTGATGLITRAHLPLAPQRSQNRRSFAKSLGRRSTRVGATAPSGNTAIVTESLWTSRPKYMVPPTDDMDWSPQEGDSVTVAGGSGNSDSSREELTHAKVGDQPSHIF